MLLIFTLLASIVALANSSSEAANATSKNSKG
jgi:hypothetical protein